MKTTDGAAGQEEEQESGFTLIELSVVMVISAMVTVILFEALHYKAMQDNQQTTLEAMDNLDGALTEFVGTYGRYPCPAKLGLAPTAANYGVEDCAGSKLVTVGVIQGNTGNPDGVLIGDIPVTTIAPMLTYAHLRTVSTLDGWGNRIQYAVTQSLTSKATYNFNNGAINVVDENGQSVLNVPNTAHMVLISFGDDGRGGYTAAGAPTAQACGVSRAAPPPGPPPVPAPTNYDEWDNCDNNNSTFVDGLRNMSQWSYNDDTVKFETIAASSLWTGVGTFPTGALPGPGTYNQITNANYTMGGKVGIGTDTPAAALEVAGAVTATNVQATRYCDQTGNNCLLASKLGGNDALMSCGANQAIDYIYLDPLAPHNPNLPVGDIRVHCSPIFPGPIAASCPAGQYITAISNLGNVKCVTYGGVCDNSHVGGCTTGTAGGISDNGTTTTWTCTSASGGPVASCSIADSGGVAVNGVCGGARYACSPGSSVANADNGTISTWTCNGANGGSNASCSLADGGGGGGSCPCAGVCQQAGPSIFTPVGANDCQVCLTSQNYTTPLPDCQPVFQPPVPNGSCYNLGYACP